MFGINSQAVHQNGAVNNYDQGLPVGGDDLLPSGTDAPAPANSVPQSDNSPMMDGPAMPTQSTSTPISSGSGNNDLFDIKKDALQQLMPLVSQLDQPPEEKFRTTMMLIQATDDKSMLRSAYQAALQIPDEKARAQALLDVVNEINYFTHPEAQ